MLIKKCLMLPRLYLFFDDGFFDEWKVKKKKNYIKSFVAL